MAHYAMSSTADRTGPAGVPAEPPRDCPICPRLVAYRRQNQTQHPEWFNGPAPSFGDPLAQLLVVGLAPGRTGANRTGRPFTGDFAGVLLYETLIKFGFAVGSYGAAIDDGLHLIDCMITNAVRCAPPANKATSAEETSCRPFLNARIGALPRLKVIIALGEVARRNVIRALGERPAPGRGHGVETDLGRYCLISSYHCSRLNTNTGRLTAAMFETIFERARALISGPTQP
jgi:uracil-DNA glycosylase family 4